METEEVAESIFHQIRKQQVTSLSKILDEYNRGEIGVLSYLFFDSDNVLAGKLSEELNVTTARIASILNSLENKGLIKRYPNEADKRKTVVGITLEGKKLASQVKDDAIKNIKYVIDELGIEDTKEYIRLANKIKNILIKQ